MKKLWETAQESYRWYTPEELARLREQLRVNNAQAAEEVRKRGVTLHPRIAEHRRRLAELR